MLNFTFGGAQFGDPPWGLRHSLTACASALAISISISLPAKAQSVWNLPEFNQATEAFRNEDCRAAWDIVWPLAKQGNHEARYFLAMAMVGRLAPPGLPRELPEAAWDRHSLTLFAYAALATQSPTPWHGDPSHRWARKEVPLLIKKLALGLNGSRVAQCYASDASFQDCLDLAVSLGVVQRFEDYARDVERAARETGIQAWCWRPH
jgi:hypothetical protein